MTAAASNDALAPLLLDLAAVAALTSLSERTIRRMASEATLPGAVRIGRRLLFRHAALAEWVARGCPAIRPPKK